MATPPASRRSWPTLIAPRSCQRQRTSSCVSHTSRRSNAGTRCTTGARCAAWRSIGRASARPLKGTPGLRRLTEDDAAALDGFYAAYPASTFTPDQLAHGVFYGVWEDDRLVAAAGTHVVAAVYGIAAVGNVFTVPEARGRGYGAATTAGVVGALLDGPCDEVILNVVAANTVARAIYTRLGFAEHCPYFEARATLRPA